MTVWYTARVCKYWYHLLSAGSGHASLSGFHRNSQYLIHLCFAYHLDVWTALSRNARRETDILAAAGTLKKNVENGQPHWIGNSLALKQLAQEGLENNLTSYIYIYYIYIYIYIYLGVSKNKGTPISMNFNRVFHYTPSILGYPYFWKHPFRDLKNVKDFCTEKKAPWLKPSRHTTTDISTWKKVLRNLKLMSAK